jgi:D-alanyl-D-alanine carboxypeptidase
VGSLEDTGERDERDVIGDPAGSVPAGETGEARDDAPLDDPASATSEIREEAAPSAPEDTGEGDGTLDAAGRESAPADALGDAPEAPVREDDPGDAVDTTPEASVFEDTSAGGRDEATEASVPEEAADEITLDAVPQVAAHDDALDDATEASVLEDAADEALDAEPQVAARESSATDALHDVPTPALGGNAPDDSILDAAPQATVGESEQTDALQPTLREDAPAETGAGDPTADAPTMVEAAPETGTVPAFLGLFADAPAPIGYAGAGDETPTDTPNPDERPVESTDTDSVRIFAEMFRGFRRGSAVAAPAGAAQADAGADDGTDDEADAETVDDAAGDEATGPVAVVGTTAPADFAAVLAGSAAPPRTHISKENDVSTSEPSGPATARPVKTTYVPSDASNETEQALAWLASENVASGQAPAIGSAVSIVPRRRRRWVAAVFAPFVTAMILAVVYLVAFAVWPLDKVSPTAANAEISTPVAPVVDLPWPDAGQSAILVGDDETPLTPTAGDEVLAPAPTASLAKVITVMTILNKQPLEPGDDGPVYEFGWADKQQYDAMLWSGESALQVPVDGTLTYRQILEGIMLASAGNYVNKLVDNLWDFNRDAFRADALKWLQDNDLSDTNLADPTGINPQTQSTATDLVRIAEIAMQDPTFAEIVGEDEVVLPGAGLVENSNPLLGELGVVGIKTGHLNTWQNVSYNLMAAADVPLSDEPGADTVRVYSVVTGQPEPTEQQPFGQQTRELLQAVTDALQPVEAMAAGTVVGTVTTPWGASTNVIAADTAELSLWNGEEAEVTLDYDVSLGAAAGTEVGTVTLTGEFGSTTVPLTTTKELPRPSIEWRLSHPLELMGFGK